jgi:Tfp pilus assembly protein PilP
MYDDETFTARPMSRPATEPIQASLRPHAGPDLDLMIAGPTPDNVAETALEPASLPLDELALVGIFAKPDGTMALVREASGVIRSLELGDVTGRMTVIALTDDSVRLSDGNGVSYTLTMPT